MENQRLTKLKHLQCTVKHSINVRLTKSAERGLDSRRTEPERKLKGNVTLITSSWNDEADYNRLSVLCSLFIWLLSKL